MTGIGTSAPRLLHAGTYALWETPAGGRHLVYQRTRATDPGTDDVRDVDSEDCHLPDFPPEALPLLSAFLEHGIPPAVLTVMQGMAGGNGGGRLATLRSLMGLAGQLGQPGQEDTDGE